MDAMKTSSEIRHENLLRIIESVGSLQVVADKLEKSHAQISQLKTQAKHSTSGKPRVIGDDIARLIEEKFNLEVGWMDNIHVQDTDALPVAQISSWPFSVSPLRLQVLTRDDWNQLNTVMSTLVEVREREASVKRNGTIG
ncbi:hypothetical protein [Acidovorax sp. SUPP2825]|uniref:hypothetical protein n=1 Tax=Acidovorax sp. SUPP2825 TaxID=2920879 RepID=UPI0023DE4380|nr:hypothetical protein [Acidovorax sp. SUPP2825]GKS96927.1 hypothetical protein AVAK2825_20350 [Acidovorax sp. SUPP2825]